jgi:hypothetical protein
MNQFPPSPRVFHLNRFRKYAEIFASQDAPSVSTTQVANFSSISRQQRRWQIATGINDTVGKFAAGGVDTGGK